MKREIKMKREELKKQLEEKTLQYKVSRTETERLNKEIEHLKKQLLSMDYNLMKWKLHAVNQYSLDGEFIKEWKSVSEVKKQLGIDIYPAIKGKKKAVGGFRWAYSIER